MSLDRSLKTSGGLRRHRNVLTRPERIARLEEQDQWDDSQSIFGLPKVGHRKASVGGKVKKQEDQTTEATEGAAKSEG